MDKFNEIQVFLAVVDEGSFSAAGRKLVRSPSMVSKIIARLERRLGVRLFDRIASAVRLTREGREFQLHALKVVESMMDAEHAVMKANTEVGGLLRINTSLTVAKYQVAPLLPLLLRQHPNLRVEFVIGTDRIDFLKHDIDVAIHSGTPTELSLVGKPLYTRRWVVAASPQYLAEHGQPQVPDDLLQHRCMDFTVRRHWNVWTFVQDGRLRNINVHGAVGANQGELLRTLALEGLGVVRLAQFHIGEDVRSGRLVPLLAQFQPQAQDLMYILYPQRVLAPRVRAFVNLMEQNLSEFL